MSRLLEVKNLSVGYHGKPVLESISFHVRPSGIACLLGPSGCGKTTLLRTVAGFEDVLAGDIRVGGRCISHVGATLAPEQRGIGMVFQENALFPHLSVEGNIAFGLRGKTNAERRAMVAELLEVVGLGDLSARFVHELSGGQQQRVAIARSLCMRPRIMLFDEPTSALDPEMIKEVLDVMIDLVDTGMTMVCVTHEMGFARKVADQMIFMDEGRIVEQAPPAIFFESPRSERTKLFLSQILSH